MLLLEGAKFTVDITFLSKEGLSWNNRQGKAILFLHRDLAMLQKSPFTLCGNPNWFNEWFRWRNLFSVLIIQHDFISFSNLSQLVWNNGGLLYNNVGKPQKKNFFIKKEHSWVKVNKPYGGFRIKFQVLW